MRQGRRRHDALKVAVIGGGSSYTPELVDGIVQRASELPVGHIALVDIPEGREKLEVVAGLAKRMIGRAGLDIEVTAGFDVEGALSGADFVITQFRVGGLAARAEDERLPLKYGVIGQETTGPGGFANALRTVPVALDIARTVERVAPGAWLVNFTNPSGVVTEAILRHSRVRCIGLCNVPITMQRTIAGCLAADPASVKLEFVGLNHLSWARRVTVNGEDVTSLVLGHELVRRMFDFGDARGREEVACDARRVPGLIDSLGMIPSYYMRYYYCHDAVVREELENVKQGRGTRADQVMAIERELFRKFADPGLSEKPPELSQRGGAWYSEAALACISAIYNDRDEVHVLNVQSEGAISDLPRDAVVEVNCLVNGAGARPIAQGFLPGAVRGLVQHVKAYETLTVEAAVTGDASMAYLALLAHPLVPGAETAGRLLEDIMKANAGYLKQFKKNRGL